MVVDTQPQEKKLPVHKSIYLLPNLITSLSMFMGFLSMVWAVQSRFEEAGLAIVLSALLDGMDGKVARLTHTASEFGVQYDSLADLIAFGLAPAFLLWQWQLESLGRFGVVGAFLFAACGALRLARFNISTAVTGKRFFIGLPIPAAGCTVVAFLYFAGILPEFFLPALPYVSIVIALGLGVLMVSRVRYFSFKEYDFLRAHPVRYLLAVMVIFGLVYAQPRLFGFLLCAVYICGGLYYSFVILPRRNRQLLRALNLQDEEKAA